MVGHGGNSAGSHLAHPTSPITSHSASIVVTSTLRVNLSLFDLWLVFCCDDVPLKVMWLDRDSLSIYDNLHYCKSTNFGVQLYLANLAN